MCHFHSLFKVSRTLLIMFFKVNLNLWKKNVFFNIATFRSVETFMTLVELASFILLFQYLPLELRKKNCPHIRNWNNFYTVRIGIWAFDLPVTNRSIRSTLNYKLQYCKSRNFFKFLMNDTRSDIIVFVCYLALQTYTLYYL